MSELALEPGDTLLIQGEKDSIKALRTQSDLLPMEWATSEISSKDISKKSIYIFLSVIFLGAFEVLPLVVAALMGVVFMIMFQVLSIRQVIRSVDNNLLLLKTEMNAGHGGKSGRDGAIEEIAFDYAFALKISKKI